MAAQPTCTEKLENYEEHCCLTGIIANLVSLLMQMNFFIIQSHVVFFSREKRMGCKKKNNRTRIHVLKEPTEGSNLSS